MGSKRGPSKRAIDAIKARLTALHAELDECTDDAVVADYLQRIHALEQQLNGSIDGSMSYTWARQRSKNKPPIPAGTPIAEAVALGYKPDAFHEDNRVELTGYVSDLDGGVCVNGQSYRRMVLSVKRWSKYVVCAFTDRFLVMEFDGSCTTSCLICDGLHVRIVGQLHTKVDTDETGAKFTSFCIVAESIAEETVAANSDPDLIDNYTPFPNSYLGLFANEASCDGAINLRTLRTVVSMKRDADAVMSRLHTV